MIDLRVLERWELSAPSAVERLGGTNNLSWRVETGEGSYVLRFYQNAGRFPHIAYEHKLLLQLTEMGLSFAVPAPIVSAGGGTLELIEDGSHGSAHASLFHVIPGRYPLPDVPETRAAGRALGELDEALRRVEISGDLPRFSTHAHLEQIHPLVTDPSAAVRSFPVDEDLRNRFGRLVERAEEAGRELYRALPSQIIHADIARSNMLVEDGQVAGILDFEFAGPDLRVLDPAVGISMFGADWSSGSFTFNMLLVQAFAEGYRECTRLEAAEVAAIPDVLRLRSAVSVIHRLGRWKAGLASVDDVASRMREGLRLNQWFHTHPNHLLQAIAPSS